MQHPSARHTSRLHTQGLELSISSLLTTICWCSTKRTSITKSTSTAICWRTTKAWVSSHRWSRESKGHQVQVCIALRLLLLLFAFRLLYKQTYVSASGSSLIVQNHIDILMTSQSYKACKHSRLSKRHVELGRPA